MVSHNRHTPQPDMPGQAELFGVGSHDGLTYVREASQPDNQPVPAPAIPEAGISVPVTERAKHLDLALGHLATGSRSAGFMRRQELADAPHIKKQYGAGLDAVNAFVDDNANNYMKLVRSELRQAYGDPGSLLQAGLGRKEEIDGDLMLAANTLRYRYGSALHRKERDAYRKQLKTSAGIIAGTIMPRRRKYQASAEISAPKPEPIVEDNPLEQNLELKPLDTRQRLIALRDDPKAGFLPSTHLEKSEAISVLDYLDPAKYPNGINDHLQEIYDHQKALAAKKSKQQRLASQRGEAIEGEPIVSQVAYAEAGRTSVIHTYGDFMSNAKTQLGRLQELQAIVDDCPNPNVLIQEEAGDYHEGYAAVVQFLDLLALREEDKRTTEYDPLRAVKNRRIDQTFAGKHKTVMDIYTGDTTDEAVENHIANVIAGLSVKELRSVLPAVIDSQARRAGFWAGRLQEIRYNQVARDILQVA